VCSLPAFEKRGIVRLRFSADLSASIGVLILTVGSVKKVVTRAARNSFPTKP